MTWCLDAVAVVAVVCFFVNCVVIDRCLLVLALRQMSYFLQM